MGLALVLLGVSAIFFILVGATDKVTDEVGEKKTLVVVLLLIAMTATTGSGVSLHVTGMGKVSPPWFMSRQIYAVVGQVETSLGVVAIVEDSDCKVYAVWVKMHDDMPDLPKDAKFARIDKVNSHFCLSAVEPLGK